MMNQSEANRLFSYNPSTGVIKWSVNVGKKIKAGDVAGTVLSTGYVSIIVKGKAYKAHRIAWLIMFGVNPDCDIDHVNRNRSDNRACNLRLATRSQNAINSSVSSSNSSGFKGVSFNKASGKWVANMVIDGKQKQLCKSESKEDAINAYKVASLKIHGEFSPFYGKEMNDEKD